MLSLKHEALLLKVILGAVAWKIWFTEMSITTMRNFFRCSDKELQKSRAKPMKLGKKLLITTFYENDI